MKAILTDSPTYRLEERGCLALSDVEALSLVVGRKSDKINELLKSVDYSLRELARFCIADYLQAGFTRREASAIIGAFEIGRRKQFSEAKERPQIKQSKDVADILQPLLTDLIHEEFWIIYMNRTNKILKIDRLSTGGWSGTVTDVRMILKKAIEVGASGIICAHNHPSGNLSPSESDTKITRQIKDAGAILDIQLLDHIIIAEADYYSFADNGLI
jgi:DNA repair protein RadC